MKKFLKRLSATFFAGILAVASVPGGFAKAAQDASKLTDGTAYLNINNADWGEFEATWTNAEITGDGTYTVSMEATEAQTLAPFNALEVVNGESVMGNQSIITVDEIKLNGEAIELQGYSYTCSADGAGVTTRVNLYNEWNKPTDDTGAVAADTRCEKDAAQASPMLWTKEQLEGVKSLDVTFTVSHFGENVEVVAPAVQKKEAEPLPAEGTQSYITFSDTGWANQWWNDGNEYATVTMNQATVTGEGEYTVSCEIKATEEAPAKGFAFMDIEIKDGEKYFPYGYMNIKSVKINGEEVALTGKTYTSSDDGITTRTNLYNEWVNTSDATFGGRTADGSSDVTPTPVDVSAYADKDITSIEVTYELIAEAVPFGSYIETAEEEVDTNGPWTAFLMFADGKEESWQNYNMGVGNETSVTGDGVYEVSLTAEQAGGKGKAEPQDGALVFLVDIDGMGKAMKSVGTLRANDKDELKDTDAKVKFAVFVDGQRITTNSDSLVLGDIEGNGRFRIDISNAYDGSGTGISENPACDTAALTPEKEIKVVFAITGTGVGTASADTDLEAYITANGLGGETTEAVTTEKATEEKTTEKATAAPATTEAKDDDKDEGLSGGVIAAIIGGAVVVLGAICALIFKKKK
ncbi:hypothetical protein SAMN04487934_101586 [Eubacterium ruminantium]|nr:hypothetical protein SAMN04487934_101586 [Eubacterium ruminantium]